MLILLLVIQQAFCQRKLVTYINKISVWNDQDIILKDLGVPGYSNDDYTHYNLAFWTSTDGPVDIGLLWSTADEYFDEKFGKSKSEKQINIKSLYNKQNKKLMVSAFGSTDMPTNQDPEQVCERLGQFVIDNNLDGVDLDYEDNAAMESGIAEEWLIKCTKKLRQMLPKQIISHAPQAPYFMGTIKYKNGGYNKIHREVGDIIDFYNIQYYNQGDSAYNSYQSLFENSDGWATNTAVKQLIDQGIESDKIIIGKPVTQKDAYNSGWVDPKQLNVWSLQAKNEFGWNAGFMTWQFASDNGSYINAIKNRQS